LPESDAPSPGLDVLATLAHPGNKRGPIDLRSMGVANSSYLILTR
jgi:hypothetical protein